MNIEVAYFMKKETLIHRIEEAFSSVPYPGDDMIDNCYYDDFYPDETTDVFCGKHWKDIVDDVGPQYSGDLCFMTPEAYHFFLPAF